MGLEQLKRSLDDKVNPNHHGQAGVLKVGIFLYIDAGCKLEVHTSTESNGLVNKSRFIYQQQLNVGLSQGFLKKSSSIQGSYTSHAPPLLCM
jgi:hypothetical protein